MLYRSVYMYKSSGDRIEAAEGCGVCCVCARGAERAEGVESRPTGARSRLPRKRADNTRLQIELHTLSLTGEY